ncbi:gag/pol protein [Gossypium australe]|uniref:Gag/pol protein n=1 Tax=Gossypium australe TaxID=47621 RepID=A0A5B6WQ16_9ROSI|nr:gag/pol protein [Gossypium australe]
MYVIFCTHLDIYFVVGMINQYQTDPCLRHWQAVKHILRYLKRTKGYMLVYSRENLTHSDFQTCKDSRKSTSGSVFVLGSGAIVWRSVGQTCTADLLRRSNMWLLLRQKKKR